MEDSELMESKMNSGFGVIDLERFEESSYEKLRKGCEERGIFRIINHGISQSLMSEMMDVAKSLFDRPMEIKRRNVDTMVSCGHSAPTQHSPVYEAMGFCELGSAQAQLSFCNQLDASPHQRAVIEKYTEAVQKLAMEMARKLSKSIGLDGDDLFKEWSRQFRMNKYHFTSETLGMPAIRTHTDSGFLTILQDDEIVEGLEVINGSSGEFEAVDPWPGTFLLILGDVAKAWSNGRFANVAHTVRCKRASSRFSLALFLLGPNEGKVQAPAELVDKENPRLYSPFIYEEYRQLRLSKVMLAGEALELVRL